MSTWRLLAHVAGIAPEAGTTTAQLWPNCALDVQVWETKICKQRAHYLANPPLSYVAWTAMSWNPTSLQNLWTPAALGKRQTIARALELGPVLLQEGFSGRDDNEASVLWDLVPNLLQEMPSPRARVRHQYPSRAWSRIKVVEWP